MVTTEPELDDAGGPPPAIDEGGPKPEGGPVPAAPEGEPEPEGGPLAPEGGPETTLEDDGGAVRVVVQQLVLVDRNEDEFDEAEAEDGTKMVDTVVLVGTQLPGVRVAQFGSLNGSE
jgi:hypothetical protein